MLIYRTVFMTRDLEPSIITEIELSDNFTATDALRKAKNRAKARDEMIMSTDIIEVGDDWWPEG